MKRKHTTQLSYKYLKFKITLSLVDSSLATQLDNKAATKTKAKTRTTIHKENTTHISAWVTLLDKELHVETELKVF